MLRLRFIATLKTHHYNIQKTAKNLGMVRQTVYYYLKKFKIDIRQLAR